jgi:hypothetical protein
MTLREAIWFAKTNGGWVVYDSPPNWSEYSVQHTWKFGVLHWTAGGTVGGEMPLGIGDIRIRKRLEDQGFNVYPAWKSTTPLNG